MQDENEEECLYIVAKWIDNVRFGYECPCCWTKRKKNGQPYKTAKPIIHTHGSCGNLSNRIESRCPHCDSSNKRWEKIGNFLIVIDDTTERR
tara:strand:- start:78 stop:353 length:276 start_codon:yes stop_codon:yes gene_type:complete